MRSLEVTYKRQSGRRYLLTTLGRTGIRVSELTFITVQAVQNRRTEIHLKEKYRTILPPSNYASNSLHIARSFKNLTGLADIGGRSPPELTRIHVAKSTKAYCKFMNIFEYNDIIV